MSKYNFALQKPKVEEKIYKYDLDKELEYKLHVQFPTGKKVLTYKPHTSEMFDNGHPIPLTGINSWYNPQKFDDWKVGTPDKPVGKVDKPRVVKIQMGLKCNYACSYCNQASQVPNSIQGNPQDAHDWLDNLDNWFKGDGNKVRWEFWGGEPLVYIKVLRVLVEGLRKRFPKAEFNMITNASMMTEEIVDWLVEMGMQVGISHDGHVYDQQRGDDILKDPKIAKVVRYAYDKLFPLGRIGFNCVLTVKNYSFKKVRKHIGDLIGISEYDIPLTSEEIMLPYDSGGMMLSPTLPHEQREMLDVLFEETSSGGLMGVSTVYDKLDDFFKSLIYKRPSKSMGQKCGMDDPKTIAVDLKNNVMTCQNTNSQLEKHNIGSTDNISAIEMKLNHHHTTRAECVRCPVVQMCKGACLFLENQYWEKACDVSYHYNTALFATAIFILTGGLLIEIEGTPRRDTMTDRFRVVSDEMVKIFEERGVNAN